MSRVTYFLRGVAAAGIGAAVVAATRNAADARAAKEFYTQELQSTPPQQAGAGYGGTPIHFHDSESSETYHSASYEAVRRALPTDELYPVRLPGGRAVVVVGALQHGEVTANGVDGLAALPYGEVIVAALVTRQPAPPFVPLLAPSRSGIAAGGFVLHLPVTTRVARDVGLLLWGYPKFVADMEFHDSIAEMGVRLSEGGHDILTMRTRPTGQPAVAREPWVLYSVLAGDLIEMAMPTLALRQMRWGSAGGVLELGDHQIADELRRLDISTTPFLTVRQTKMHFAMTLGRHVGRAMQYEGFIGEERDLGRYVMRYPNTAPIDRYAPYVRTAGPATAIANMSTMVEPVAVG